MNGGAGTERADAGVAGGVGVAFGGHCFGQFKGLQGQLHGLERNLGGVFGRFLHGMLSGGLFRFRAFGQAHRFYDAVEGAGVLIHQAKQGVFELLAFFGPF